MSKSFLGQFPPRAFGLDVSANLPEHRLTLTRFHRCKSLLHSKRRLQIVNDLESLTCDLLGRYASRVRIYLACASALLIVATAGCGGSATPALAGDAGATVQGDVAVSDAPSPTSAAVAPAATVVTCKIDNGLPVAEVKVTNTTGQTEAFSVEVQFQRGSTVLGSGMEFTRKLAPGQDQTVRMGNMQGDAPAVDACKVIAAGPMTE